MLNRRQQLQRGHLGGGGRNGRKLKSWLEMRMGKIDLGSWEQRGWQSGALVGLGGDALGGWVKWRCVRSLELRLSADFYDRQWTVIQGPLSGWWMRPKLMVSKKSLWGADWDKRNRKGIRVSISLSFLGPVKTPFELIHPIFQIRDYWPVVLDVGLIKMYFSCYLLIGSAKTGLA